MITDQFLPSYFYLTYFLSNQNRVQKKKKQKQKQKQYKCDDWGLQGWDLRAQWSIVGVLFFASTLFILLFNHTQYKFLQ